MATRFQDGIMEERVIIVIGKTGNGKSATCNTLLETKEFEEFKGGMSTTADCKLVKKVVRGRVLSMIDTLGTMHVKDPQRARDTLLEAVDLCHNGIDAFLITFRCDVWATDEELKAAEEAVELFGPECYNRAIVVFTRSAEFDNDVSEFAEALRTTRRATPRFNAVLSKSGDRWVLLENGRRCEPNVRERQVSALLSMVDQVARLNPRRYRREGQEPDMLLKVHLQVRMLKAALENAQELEKSLQLQHMQAENQRLRDRLERERSDY